MPLIPKPLPLAVVMIRAVLGQQVQQHEDHGSHLIGESSGRGYRLVCNEGMGEHASVQCISAVEGNMLANDSLVGYQVL